MYSSEDAKYCDYHEFLNKSVTSSDDIADSAKVNDVIKIEKNGEYCDFLIVLQSAKSLKQDDETEDMINEMISSSANPFLTQDTWLSRNSAETSRGCTALCHDLEKSVPNRGERVEAAFLPLKMYEFYEKSSRKLLAHSRSLVYDYARRRRACI